MSGCLEKRVLHPGFTELSLHCLHLSPRVTKAKPVRHGAGGICGQIAASRTVGSSISSKCLTYIMAESTGSGYKTRSEKPSCLAVVSVRSGIVGHRLVYCPRRTQGRRRKHGSPAIPRYIPVIKLSVWTVPAVAHSTCTGETFTHVCLCTFPSELILVLPT